MAHPLRDDARDQTCTLQLFPYCTGTTDATVLCHLPSPSNGMALKQAEDWFAVDGCHGCHDILDGRRVVKDIPPAELASLVMRALHRTLSRRIDNGLIQIKGEHF